MRALILAFFVLAIVAGVPSAEAGLSTTLRETSASVETVIIADEAEDQIGLTKAERRDLQRRLTKLGFGTKINGEFDESTRAAIARWQERHGYPKTGFLDAPQHEALLSESASATDAGKSNRGRGWARAPGGGPIGAIGSVVGGVVGGIFRR